MIIPGILETKFENIVKKVKELEGEYKVIQIDVADGILVDGATFQNVERLGSIETPAELEIHLMTQNPAASLNGKIAGVTKMCAQVEGENVEKFLDKAHALGYRVGLSIKPDTSLQKLEPHLSKVNYVQFMTVEPGAQGRKFEEEVPEKIRQFKATHPNMPIQADGGINKENMHKVLNAGVTNVVIGSAIDQFKED